MGRGSLGDLVGTLFGAVAGAPDGTHVRIWNELRPWTSTLMASAARKWVPFLSIEQRCSVQVMRAGHVVGACDHQAIAACDCCGRPVCLQHSRVDQHAEAICYLCLAEAMKILRERQQRGAAGGAPPPRSSSAPTDAAIAQALKTLGLKRGASWEEVRAAHRKLSAKHHPDRHPPNKKAAAEARFVKVQQALDLLRTQFPEAA